MSLTYDRNELLGALSYALDLAGWLPLNHAARTAYVALHIAKAMGLPDVEVEDIYVAVYLHDVELIGSVRENSGHEGSDRSEKASSFVSSMSFSPKAAEYVRWHHTPVEAEAGYGDIPLGAQILRLADLFELRYDRDRYYGDQSDEHIEWAKDKRQAEFAPEIVDAFLAVSAREKFWLDFAGSNLEICLREMSPVLTAQLTRREVEQIANVFAGIIDSKSSFTYRHSRGVAELMDKLAPKVLSSDKDIFQIRVAALLHDLGKLAVPTNVLDKPGKLTPREFELVKAHPYYTKVILSKVRGFEVIKEWAGNHHEYTDGKGYPEHRTDLSTPEKLMSVADVYQALTEERPYRPPLSKKEALAVMDKMVKEKKLCGGAVEMLRNAI